MPSTNVAFSLPPYLNALGKRQAPRVVALGDSITAGGLGGSGTSSSLQTWGQSYAALVGVLYGNLIRMVHNAGVPGNTSAQMIARFATDVTPFAPDIVLILAGTNDLSTTSGITLAQSQANIQALVQMTLAIGAIPILQTIPPRYYGSTIGVSNFQDRMRFNQWIKAYAINNGFPFVAHHDTLVDPVTGEYQVQYALSLTGATAGTYTINSAPPISGGSYIQYNGTNLIGTTSAIAYNATAAQVQTALNAAVGNQTNVGYPMYLVSGNAGGPYTIRCAAGFPFVLTIANNSVTGATPAITNLNQLTVDGIHPSTLSQNGTCGQRIMANNVGAVLSALFPAASLPFQSLLSDTNGNGTIPISNPAQLIYNGNFQYQPTTLAPYGWTLNTSGFTYSGSTDASGTYWLTAVSTGTSGAYMLQGAVQSSRYNAGDTIAISGRIQVSGLQAQANGQLTVGIYSNGQWISAPIYDWDQDFSNGYFYQEIIVPTGGNSMNFNVYLQGASGVTVSIAMFSAVNLTQLGVVSTSY
jgi:lysophospholipase L1-like esterase